MRIGERTYNIKLGFAIFLSITLISIAIILYIDFDKRTWEGLKEIKPIYGLIAGALMVIQWLLNGLRFQILINSFKEKVDFRTSFNAFMANIFMSAMTPSQTGGGPLQII
ncbi:TPA: flippase-like domain-containing protein, partial [bacterium]|nr:flippase-like domain-containing protein [bacterium]